MQKNNPKKLELWVGRTSHRPSERLSEVVRRDWLIKVTLQVQGGGLRVKVQGCSI